MIYYDLKNLSTEDLMGNWAIISRYPADRNLEFLTDHICLNGSDEFECGSGVKGLWKLIKEDSIIYHPQVKFLFMTN